MKRVVVTGIGLLTSLGSNYKDSWYNLLSGNSGIKKINHFDTDDLSCKIAGYLKDTFDPLDFLDSRDIKRNDRFIQYGLIASTFSSFSCKHRITIFRTEVHHITSQG